MRNLAFLILGVNMFLFTSCNGEKNKGLPEPQKVKDLIIKVNDHWQQTHPEHGRAFWDNAAYHTGNIEAYKVTRLKRYLDYSREWAERNQWMGAKSTNPSQWRYSYGETDEYVLFGDWQICFQTYIDLFQLVDDPNEKMIARAREVMEYQIQTDTIDYWWWSDGLYMVMPVMTKLYKLTGNEKYLDKLYEYYSYAKSIMYDEETGLFYRDAKYVFPKHKTLNNRKDFWSRGNGWVFAGFAKVLDDLPKDSPYFNSFVKDFRRMAQSLKSIQHSNGYWTRSLLDSEHAPGPETSGTAFFCYGFLWGINNEILEKDEFIPTAIKAWEYLTETALQNDGSIGYVQPIGERAIPGQVVDKNSTSNFGTGAFLLAASELYRLVSRR
ncbi:glycoside hydrolase family 88/105 protein [Thermophagus xiamenensis]|uniref:Rhamnogalacturonyl hydrolase YesR n=1 Tax=Thermophagus xiamenensis TaxID=385682 RepID=A0A1I2AUZ6_9BACT|nr:glycoside hydrolase family 88 protein [Thermophagus xiamenensis]SFE47804.1 Rhamnogalacturonyl hydrolase YesR [Thermophagus xiamenensis]